MWERIMRKKFLINKAFQFKFILFMMGVGLISLAATFLVLQGFFREFQSLADASHLAPNHPFRDLISYQKDQMNIFFIGLAVINVAITAICGLWMSHRIAGPIYRIVQTLKNPAAKEEKKTFNTRKGDYFQELPEALNEYVQNQ